MRVASGAELHARFSSVAGECAVICFVYEEMLPCRPRMLTVGKGAGLQLGRLEFASSLRTGNGGSTDEA